MAASAPSLVPDATPVLAVEGLTTCLNTRAGKVTVVDGLDLTVRAGETLAIVGESGSGKSMTALSLMRLLPDGVAFNAGGAARLNGRDLLSLSERDMRRLRGADISMIFQEPMTSLNPVMRIGRQLMEVFEEHRPELSAQQRREKATDLLKLVRIPDPARVLDDLPHHLSGGMRQRVMIAMALACEPKLLIADEPTTALDATVQAQILDLLRTLQAELGLAIVLITHNLGVVAQNAHRVLVMYAGRKVEEAPVAELFRTPRHPYTRGLLRALPNPDAGGGREPLMEIPGIVPALSALPKGCAFQPRCPVAIDACAQTRPALRDVGPAKVACILATEGVPA
ncbi:ABC transporter ATP-binding protein [Azorhizobium oxalatiphilum]|uniref:ABC transporter ATP-binding protein n=1 Tax=Azorhizobium oxalatiphilum TaxID=980631 RepID=A0A917CBP2_9HYPH|nr:ABC transporter ATP-binding protein [Azorhizobium oxalatiphilum]GGF77288.1 ABC transporter ATP-binding protein [Azorhizobium oxalatiphilum]